MYDGEGWTCGDLGGGGTRGRDRRESTSRTGPREPVEMGKRRGRVDVGTVGIGNHIDDKQRVDRPRDSRLSEVKGRGGGHALCRTGPQYSFRPLLPLNRAHCPCFAGLLGVCTILLPGG